MKNVMPRGRARTRSYFKGETCSRLSVRGVTNACHASSAWRFAQRSGYSAILLSAILWPFIVSSAFAQADAEFSKANKEYAQGHFKEAISDYEALIRDG